MSTFRKKLAIQFFVTNGSTVVSFILSMILARLLAPAEIGIYSLTAAAVGFAHVFRDFGVASFIRQHRDLTDEVLRAAMGVLILSSWTLAAILYLVSGSIAQFFGQPGVQQAMQVVALGFVFIPFGSVPQAVLSRDMQVEKNAFVVAVSSTVYFFACIGFAKFGFSYMSMAWANIVNILASTFCYTLVRPAGLPWMPSLRGWRKVVNFGLGAMLTSAFSAIDNALGDILLGRLSGPHLVGLFSRANSTVNILNHISGPTINYVALPYLSKVHHSGEAVSTEVIRVVAYITGILWPALLATAIFGQDLIRVLYGDTWLGCAEAMPWLCVVVAVQGTVSFLQPALTGVGRPYMTAFPMLLGVAIKIGVALAHFDGTLVSFAQAYMLAELATLPVYLFLAHRVLGIGIRAWWGALHQSLLLAGVFAAGLGACWLLLGGLNVPWLKLVIAFILMLPLWWLTICVGKHPLAPELGRFRNYLRKRHE